MTLRTAIEERVQAFGKARRDRAISDLERKRTGMAWDPMAHLQNPYPHYAEFRERDPVHHHPRIDGLVLTRHEDCLATLRDPRFSSDSRELRLFEQLKARQKRDGGDTRSMDNPGMIGLDGSEHARLRKLVSKGFTPRAIAALAPRVEEIAAVLLDEVPARGSFDWMEGVAYPLPSIVIAEMLGVPKEDRDRFLAWSVDMLAGGPLETRARRQRANRANTEMGAYFVEIIEARRAEPGPDILSALIRVQEEDGDRLKPVELIGTCMLLLVAGHAGTSAMIGNGLLCLLRNPEQLELLRGDPSLWPMAVEEMLRFEGAVQGMGRIAKEEVRIHGKRLRKGQTALLALGSANRDPEVFDAPDHFIITRHPNEHLALGKGHHFCLGASLARLEIQIALRSLLERFPKLEIATPDLRWSPTGMRTLTHLPLHLTHPA